VQTTLAAADLSEDVFAQVAAILIVSVVAAMAAVWLRLPVPDRVRRGRGGRRGSRRRAHRPADVARLTRAGADHVLLPYVSAARDVVDLVST
jgi:hypothetical protein